MTDTPARHDYTLEVYRTHGAYRWRFTHRNGNILADSAEGYSRYEDCLHSAAVVTAMPLAEFDNAIHNPATGFTFTSADRVIYFTGYARPDSRKA